MSVLVPIGDFSRMTHLSVKALRFYHDQGLLEPARIDPSSGYRFYDPGQVPIAQVIRRFRDLDMPLDQVRAVLTAPDVETRTKEIIAHLNAMETKLAELQMSVSSLRALLEGPAVRPEVEFRSIPATRALAVRGTVTVQQAWAWGTDVFGEIYRRIEQAGLIPGSPGLDVFLPSRINSPEGQDSCGSRKEGRNGHVVADTSGTSDSDPMAGDRRGRGHLAGASAGDRQVRPDGRGRVQPGRALRTAPGRDHPAGHARPSRPGSGPVG